MKFTIDWLKQHLETKYNEEKIIDKLTNIGLEVESFENQRRSAGASLLGVFQSVSDERCFIKTMSNLGGSLARRKDSKAGGFYGRGRREQQRQE